MGPLWGTPVLYLYGDPLHVPAEINDEERERLRVELEGTMSCMRKMAENYWNADGGKRESLHLYKALAKP